MRVDAFDFDLPEEQLALHPADPRDAARLLQVSASGDLSDHIVCDLPSLLQPGDLLVLNQTRVIPAQLSGLRTREGVEVGLPVYATLVEAQDEDQLVWKAMAKPGKRIKPGDRIQFSADGPGCLRADVKAKDDDGLVTLAFTGTPQTFADGLAAIGMPPLPPYIASKRGYLEEDKADYQTVYAETDGSVAAPTAGLHFTDRLFEALDARGIGRAFVTLHVGMGTFLPVKADTTEDHTMHAEWGEITPETADAINRARDNGGRSIAVGTTSLRILESAADETRTVHPFQGETAIFITPGYRFKGIDALMTNFHLPKSTLFMLVSALCGLDRMKSAYAHAIEAGYRFYSYGDGSLLWASDEALSEASR
ncbi:MAG: tRNA preQ1(34) S-adenosylmethionine ribosyltransferase-isomerase QueA [Cohaesibacteraceae bacterium]